MKIKLSELKKLIKEATLHPNIFSQKQITSIKENKNITELFNKLEVELERQFLSNSLLVNSDFYNEKTREFPDEYYNTIKEQAKHSAEYSISEMIKSLDEILKTNIKKIQIKQAS